MLSFRTLPLCHALVLLALTSLISMNSHAELSSLLANNSLVQKVTKSLDIKPAQAAGGVGSLLKVAEDNISGKDFGILKDAIPDASQLLELAPEAKRGDSPDFSIFNSEGLLGGMGILTSRFASLGLDSNMIAPIANVVMDYLKGNSSTKAYSILQSALPSDLSGAARSLLDNWNP